MHRERGLHLFKTLNPKFLSIAAKIRHIIHTRMVYYQRRKVEVINLMIIIFRKEFNIPVKDGHGKLLKVSNSELLGNVSTSEICLCTTL